ncbi:unknown [Betafusellovirus yellowstonense]|uniref:Uncharacterized protein n=1 Tax=Betafusellovirus yellowstonense TaxID=693629 RepID=D1GFA8_9VIRU|nr:hypothetical protein SSSV1_gp24 [Acidianus spindle-shaped virus 1]ACZ35809.1 unknown [Acidianus spindle-shaped virus 1]
MRRKWVIFSRDSYGDIVYLKITEKQSTARKYYAECQQFFGEICVMELGEFYTLDEAEELDSF